MNAKQVIETILNTRGFKLSYAKLAEIINIKRQNMTRYQTCDLKQEHIEKIEKHFNIRLSESNLINIDEVLQLPIYGDITASLGGGRDIFSEQVTEKFSIPKSLINKIGASPEHCCIINTDGISMYPTIIGGQDQIMVDMSKKDIFDGKIYVFRMENSLFAKRLQKLPNRKLKVISDNPEFESYIVDLNDENANFNIIGRVMWISRIC